MDEDNVVHMPTKRERLAASLKRKLAGMADDFASANEWALGVCMDMAEVRADFGDDDVGFGRWLAANDIELDKNERAAMIEMGKHPDRLRDVLAKTNRRSLEMIYRHEWDHLSENSERSPGPLRAKNLRQKANDARIEQAEQLIQGGVSTVAELMERMGVKKRVAQSIMQSARHRSMAAGQAKEATEASTPDPEEIIAKAYEQASDKGKHRLDEVIRITKDRLVRNFEATVHAEVIRRIAAADDATRKQLTEARQKITSLERIIAGMRDRLVFTQAQFRQLQLCCHPDASASAETRARVSQLLVENETRLARLK
jgi:hypothetical protein